MERIRELIEQMRLKLQLQIAIADMLSDLDKRLKVMEGYKLKNDAAVTSVRKQYDELYLITKNINKRIGDQVL